jgi:hypothetical protein
MENREIFNIRDKNSQEILLYLQKKDIEKNNKYLSSDYRKQFSHKIQMKDNNTENLPKTRMKQFMNKSFFTYEGKKSPSKSQSYDTNERTPIISTPKFIKEKSQISITILNKNRDNSQFSFSNENTINDNDTSNKSDSLNYLDFNLHENINKISKENNTSFIEDNLYHMYLPKKYKDDEEYKSRLFKYLKCETEKLYTHAITGIKTKVINPSNNSNLHLCNVSKVKKIYSEKKKDTNKITFFDNDEERGFDLYKDDNIGIDKDWQLCEFYKNYDNDVESDEEQIEKGKNKMLKDLKMGIVRWSQNKNYCHNYKRLKSPVESESIKRFSASV